MLKFFTLPPINVHWPYILVNANRPENGIRYLRHLPDFVWYYNVKDYIKEVLIDAGVEVFRYGITEYPEGWKRRIEKIVDLYYELKSFPIGTVWVVCPDYPSDYEMLPEYPNIEKTVRNVLYCIDNYPEVPWVIPVQGKREKPDSILDCIKYYEEFGITKRYDYFAIANLCVSRSNATIVNTIRIARDRLRNKKLHAFGLKMQGLAKVWRMINSADTMAWSRPCKIVDEVLLKPIGYLRKSRLKKFERAYFYGWFLTLTKKYNVQLEGIDPRRIEEFFYSEVLSIIESEDVVKNVKHFMMKRYNRLLEKVLGDKYGEAGVFGKRS